MKKNRKAVKKYNQDIDNYMQSEDFDNASIAKEMIKEADEKKLPITKDPELLKHTMDMDLRDNIPPQMYSVVSGFIELVEKLERAEKDES